MHCLVATAAAIRIGSGIGRKRATPSSVMPFYGAPVMNQLPPEGAERSEELEIREDRLGSAIVSGRYLSKAGCKSDLKLYFLISGEPVHSVICR